MKESTKRAIRTLLLLGAVLSALLCFPASAENASPLYTDGDFVFGLPLGTKVSVLRTYFEHDITVRDQRQRILSDTDTVSTGASVTMLNKKKLTFVVSGDVNANGRIDSNDLFLVRSIFLGTSPAATYTAQTAAFRAADVNANGKPDSNDYILLRQVVLGMRKSADRPRPKDAQIPNEIAGVSMKPEDVLIITNAQGVRDPFVFYENGTYYMYFTGWGMKTCARDAFPGGWSESRFDIVETPADYAGDCWAPEVHRYNGKYYMFTTYRSTINGHRGCAIFRADAPTGPFRLITDGHVTPSDWDAIDGTMYIDPQGQPWMVFVHEWTSTPDGVGTMAAAKLSEDLTHFITEPVELFRADSAPWCQSGVTDGCFMYRTQDGQLLMLWSSFGRDGYTVAIARSRNGNILGPWTQDTELLFTGNVAGPYDGGHPCVFTDVDGKMYISIHSPNNASAGRVETAVFFPVKEENGTLAWDLPVYE